jgi:hypothetical protein
MPPVPSRVNSFEQASAAAQKAVHIAGGADAVVSRISGGFPCRADATRLPLLQAALASARTELEALDLADRRSPRATDLRQTITSNIAETVGLQGVIDREREYAARACLMSACAGDPVALTTLAKYAGRVSPDFEAAVIEANR